MRKQAGPQARRFPREGAQGGIEVIGVRRTCRRDACRWCLKMPWPGFGLLMAAIHLGVSGILALLYRLDPGALTGAPGGSTAAFRFSMTAPARLGAGTVPPSGLYANSLAFAQSPSRGSSCPRWRPG